MADPGLARAILHGVEVFIIPGERPAAHFEANKLVGDALLLDLPQRLLADEVLLVEVDLPVEADLERVGFDIHIGTV